MPRWNFSFAATRPIKGADFACLLELLRARGYDVEPFYEGVRWRVEGRKDLRFTGRNGFVDPIRSYRNPTGPDHNVEIYEFVPEEVAFWPCEPVWSTENEFRPYVDGDFSEDELLAVRADIVVAFGAVENVIANEGRGVQAGDTDEAIRQFLHFDKKEAIRRWTIADDYLPETESQRQFKCWKCGEYEYAEWYTDSYEDETGPTIFERVLGQYELRGNLQCCLSCRLRMCTIQWTPQKAKKLSTRV